MLIQKVINNNVISARDDKGREIVLMGRGLGFGVKPGMSVIEEKVEKVFTIKSTTVAEQFEQLLVNMPMEHVNISTDIITYAKHTFKLKLNQSIYVTLTDHINFAIERQSMGINPENALMWEIKRFYPQEFQLGKYALELICERLRVTLPEDEAGFIALHFVNAQYGTQMKDTLRFPDQMRNIIELAETSLGLKIDEKSLHYERFVTHVKFLLQRVYRRELLTDAEEEMLLMLKKKYPREFETSKKVADYIEGETGCVLSGEEIMYLAIHVRRVTMAQEQEED